MNKVLQFYSSTLGKKVVVAVTGLFLFLFVVGHVTGNFKTFAGYDSEGVHKLDIYGEFLRTFGQELFGYAGFLWIVRIGLLAFLILHVVTIIQLWARNAAARQSRYQGQNYRVSSWAARTMFWGGLVLFAFIIFHILHLTLGTVHPDFEYGKVFSNVYIAFQNPIVVVGYVVAMTALGFHLYHGIWSMFQTLGLDNPDWNTALRVGAKALSLFIVLGFVSVPLGVFFGFVGAPQG